MDGTIYHTGNPNADFWVRVHGVPGGFRAYTNDFSFEPPVNGVGVGFYFDHIENLPYRSTREEAQADLDAIASKLGLKAVTQAEYDNRRH